MEPSWTVGRLLDWTSGFLKQKGSESPRLDAEVLLAQALGCRRIELYTRYEEDATEEARQRFRELVRQRVVRIALDSGPEVGNECRNLAIEHCLEQGLAGFPVQVDGALADAGRARNVVHGESLVAPTLQ